ncbi:PAS domain-containing protein [Leptolyngbya sp. AN03gr2]|uniref:hybrid sensor histidine kinase/response regulator n=1 Tax=unclassified Leptolyngbya TaxID=2650499 RepID=UPI003D30F66D
MQRSTIVLILDSDSADQESYRQDLTQNFNHSYKILASESGEVGLEYCLNCSPDVVLLNVSLADMDAIAFLDRLQAQQDQMPAIILLAESNAALPQVVQAMKRGAQDCLIKEELCPELLRSTIDQALVSRQSDPAVEQLNRELSATVTELQTLIELAPVGIGIAIDPSCAQMRHNVYLRQMLEVSPGRNISKSAPDGEQPAFRVMRNGQELAAEDLPMQLAARLGVEVRDTEFEIVQPNGTVRHLLSYAAPIRNPQHEITGSIGAFLDITERREIEARLQESEERLRLALEATGLGIWDWDVQHDRVTWAGDNERLFGLVPGDFDGTYEAYLNCVHPDDRETVKQCVTEALNEKRGYTQEFRVVYPDGTIHWLRTQSKLFLDADGNPVRLIGTNQDITDAKYSEIALQESERQYKTLANSIHQIIWVTDGKGEAQFANDRWRDYCGITFLEAAEDWETVVHPGDRELCRTKWEIAKRDRIPYLVEFRFRRFDGEYRWHLTHGVPTIDATGQVEQWIATITDIHDRKLAETALTESEARYRALADLIPQFVWVTNSDGQNEYANRQFCEYTGKTEAELSKLDWLEIIHPDDRTSTQERWMSAVRDGEFYEIEYRFRRFDGVYRWFLGQGQPLRNKQGRIVRWFGTCTDIHDQKQIEIERAQLLAEAQTARSEAEAASRMKDEFLAIVSHELRSPLNAMLGWTKLIRAGKLNESMQEKAIQVIERNAEAQTQLIEDLLDISRIIRGKVRLNLRSVDLVQVIEAAIDTVRPSADIKQIDLESRIETDSAIVSGDLDRLQQVVWNLLTNAVKFTPESGIVKVELSQTDSHAQIRVIDTGKGISSDFLPYVFDRFRQAENVTTRTTGGLGLGLAIVRNLVEMHNGTVRVESLGEGKGSTFIVELPLLKNNPARSGIRDLTLSIDNDVSLDGVRVLVVDDELDTREFLVTALEISGATVTAAASSREAIQQIEQSPPTVLISDIGMPNEDGYALIQKVRSLSPDRGGTIPAVALTAFARQEDRIAAIESGFQMHLSKPIEPDRLIAAVKSLTRQ